MGQGMTSAASDTHQEAVTLGLLDHTRDSGYVLNGKPEIERTDDIKTRIQELKAVGEIYHSILCIQMTFNLTE